MPARPRHLSLSDAIAALARRDHLLVACDFDGTLAPIMRHPEEVVPHPRALAALVKLASRTEITVAVVSGRRLDDLQEIIGPTPGVTLIGEHGSDYGDTEAEPRVAEIASVVEQVAERVPGSRVETKRRSVAFHYRNAAQDLVEPALRRLRHWADEAGGITSTEGKQVLELSVATRNKGDAVADLIVETGAKGVLYVGDDVTDESVFRRLGPDDVGVKVGLGETAAEYRVKDVEAVADLLERINTAVLLGRVRRVE